MASRLREKGADKGQSLPPGATIGILGGGQLGRMSALAAARLGYRTHIYAPEAESPAAEVAARWTRAAYDDLAALAAFAADVDVVTFEFENVPVPAAELLAGLKPTRPHPRILHITQERLREKRFLREIGIATAPFAEIGDVADLPRGLAEIGSPAVLKSASFGYDGKGQVRIEAETSLAEAWRRMGGSYAILEGFVDFALEISVVLARGLDGGIAAFVPVENRHKNHILDVTLAPAKIEPELAAAALDSARRIAEALDFVGILAVEMFVTRDRRLLVNELAPRPHNSGHWTIDACLTSQFEQHIRAVCGLPLGSPERHADAVMTNLIGREVETWPQLLADPEIKLHLYGKSEARPGRKMGHYTRLLPRS